MSKTDDFMAIVDLLLEDEIEEAEHHLLMENAEQQIIRAMGGDRMPMNYLLKFEEYLDDHDVYLFDGWEECVVIRKPKIDRFWTTFVVFAPKNTDLRGAVRVRDASEGQTEVKAKRVDGGIIVKFKIQKRVLDAIETRNQEKAEKLSDEEMEYF